MILVQQFGNVWGLSKRNYRKMLTAIAAGQDYDLDALGKSLGEMTPAPLDMTPERAKELLDKG
jgi:hypothetical protein